MRLVRDVHWVGNSGSGRKRIRLNRKTPAHLAGYVIHSRPRVWKRLSHVDLSSISVSDHMRRRCDENDGGCISFHPRTGGGMIPWVCAGPMLSRVHDFLSSR